MGNILTSRKPKKYKTYLLESPAHYESIARKYGMPSKAKPPVLPKDILELVIEPKMTSGMWNRRVR